MFVSGMHAGSCCGGLWFVSWLDGNSNRACAKASLMSFRVVWYFYLNSLGDSIWRVSGFWIWWRVVMLYMRSLLRFFLRLAFFLGRGGRIPRFMSMQVLLLIVLWKILYRGMYMIFVFPFE